MSKKPDTVEIDIEVVIERDLAVMITDGNVKCWIPKSSLRGQAEGYMSPDEAQPGKSGTISISQKLAEEKGLV